MLRSVGTYQPVDNRNNPQPILQQRRCETNKVMVGKAGYKAKTEKQKGEG